MRQFLTNDELNKLIQGSYWQIEAGGDVFTFSRLEMGRHNRKISPAEITERMGKRKLFSSYSGQLLLQNTVRYKKKLILNVLAGNDFVVILNNIHCGKWEESA